MGELTQKPWTNQPALFGTAEICIRISSLGSTIMKARLEQNLMWNRAWKEKELDSDFRKKQDSL
jgi:hypothetical protein